MDWPPTPRTYFGVEPTSNHTSQLTMAGNMDIKTSQRTHKLPTLIAKLLLVQAKVNTKISLKQSKITRILQLEDSIQHLILSNTNLLNPIIQDLGKKELHYNTETIYNRQCQQGICQTCTEFLYIQELVSKQRNDYKQLEICGSLIKILRAHLDKLQLAQNIIKRRLVKELKSNQINILKITPISTESSRDAII